MSKVMIREQLYLCHAPVVPKALDVVLEGELMALRKFERLGSHSREDVGVETSMVLHVERGLLWRRKPPSRRKRGV